jgi:hypothetical protein
MKLSERIKDSRTDRLDEWSMDELSRDVAKLEDQLATAKADGIREVADDWFRRVYTDTSPQINVGQALHSMADNLEGKHNENEIRGRVY